MTEKQIQKLVDKQRKYFYSGVTLDYTQRIESLKKLKDSINWHEEAIFKVVEVDLKKPKMENYMSEIMMVRMELKLALKKLKKWMRPTRVKTGMTKFLPNIFLNTQPLEVFASTMPSLTLPLSSIIIETVSPFGGL